MYFDYRLEEGPLYLTQYGGRDGLPSALENMDAAFIWEKNYKAYFFKGWEYWRYDEISKRVDPGYPKNISIWGKCLVVSGLQITDSRLPVMMTGQIFFSPDKPRFWPVK